MKHDYVQAFLSSLEAGLTVEQALAGLTTALTKKQHTKLFGPILLEVLRVLESSKANTHAVVAVAQAQDLATLKTTIKATLLELGVTKDTPVKEVIDESLVGGFVATYNYTEHDQSYKKALKSLYESITK